jgi:hypothetical protein
MKRTAAEQGMALVATLFMLVALFLLTATLFFSSFVDAQASSNVSAGSDALYTAEAGIHHLWSILDPAPDFSRELAWPAGEPPFGSPVGFPGPPRTYRVRVAPLPDGSLRATSEGTSHRGTRRKVEAIFLRQLRFRAPAALTVAAGTSLSDVSGTLEASAGDAGADVAAVGAESRAMAEALRSALRGASDVAMVGSSGLDRATAPLRDAAQTTLDGPQADGTYGSSAEPALVRLSGQAEITGTVVVQGILVCDAPLRVRGRLEVDGLLLAPQGVDVEGELVVNGAAWLAGDLRLAAAGRILASYSDASLDQAGDVGGAALPKRALLGAWREVW